MDRKAKEEILSLGEEALVLRLALEGLALPGKELSEAVAWGLGLVRSWPYPRRARFADLLGTCLGHRLGAGGKIEARFWPLYLEPVDYLRALHLTVLEGWE